jgi:antitoxin component HigA of HigAB toxin-antitoxin module
MRDFMDIMLPVVGDYEDRHHHGLDTSDLTPLDILRSLLEDHKMTAADLGRLLGNRSLGSAILRGERGLSQAHIKILSARFKLAPGAFI